MAFITFYTADATEQARLTELLGSTDHEYEFVPTSINPENLNPKSEVISIFVSDTVSRDIIEKLPNLRLIACRSTGFDHVDLQAAAEHNTTVVNVPRYGEKTVAEYTFALLLHLSRKIQLALDAVASGRIIVPELTGFDLDGKTFGIIGSGKIGQHTAKIAHGFDMKVLAYDPFPNAAKAEEIGFTYVSLDELVQQSDVISLHAPFIPGSNYHIVNDELLKKVKPGAILVNTARGELVDTTALVKALADSTLAGAALDVLEDEEFLRGANEVELAENAAADASKAQVALDIAALKTMPNVVITPHNAFNTGEAIDRIRQTTIQNIIDFYNGSTPNLVEGKK